MIRHSTANDPTPNAEADRRAERIADTQYRITELLTAALAKNGVADLPSVRLNLVDDRLFASCDLPLYVQCDDGDDGAVCLAVLLRAIADDLDGLVRREWAAKTAARTQGAIVDAIR